MRGGGGRCNASQSTRSNTTELRICPARQNDRNASALNKTSFRESKNISYSFCNVYPDTVAIAAGYKTNATTGAEFAICADLNPAGSTTYNGLTTAIETSSSKVMQTANSPNHSGQGENVLYGDGHAEFQQNPFCGQQRDCIYTVSGNAQGTVTTNKQGPAKASKASNNPLWPGDSVLMPGSNW